MKSELGTGNAGAEVGARKPIPNKSAQPRKDDAKPLNDADGFSRVTKRN